MQTERNKACFKLLRCSFSYAKEMQTECKTTTFYLISETWGTEYHAPLFKKENMCRATRISLALITPGVAPGWKRTALSARRSTIQK